MRKPRPRCARLLVVGLLALVGLGLLVVPQGSSIASESCGSTALPSPGTLQELCFEPRALDFGTVISRDPVVATVRIVNSGAEARPFGGIVVEGPESFDVLRHDCRLDNGQTGVPAHGRCEVVLGLAPAALPADSGQATALLSILRPGVALPRCADPAGCLTTIPLAARRG